jgi:Polysaccharide pyruvyl transferase
LAKISGTTRPSVGLADLYPPPQLSARRVAILGAAGAIPASHVTPTRTLFDACGGNTGNLAFFHALGAHIEAQIAYVGWDFDPDVVNAEADCLVIAAANQLNPAWDFGAVAARLERLRVPLCVVGLGAQWHGNITGLRLKAGTVRFAKVLGERTRAIGVRGERSGGVLDRIGVKNWDVVGCPSLFINQDEARLGRRIDEKFRSKGRAPEKVIVNFDVGSDMARALARTEALVGDAIVSCVWQAPLAAVAMARGDAVGQGAEHRAVTDVFALTSEPFRRRAIKSAVTFFCVDAWLEWCRSYDLSIGTRLHGNIVALQSGVPSIVVTHDGRTEELAATLKLPAIGKADFAEREGALDEVFRACAFDADAFDANRLMLLHRYVRLLDWAGVRPSPKLLALSKR